MVLLKTSLAYEAEELASRSLKIMYNRGGFATPIRALKAKGAENLRIDRRELRGVVEVYANFTLSKLEKTRQNLHRATRHYQRLYVVTLLKILYFERRE